MVVVVFVVVVVVMVGRAVRLGLLGIAVEGKVLAPVPLSVVVDGVAVGGVGDGDGGVDIGFEGKLWGVVAASAVGAEVVNVAAGCVVGCSTVEFSNLTNS